MSDTDKSNGSPPRPAAPLESPVVAAQPWALAPDVVAAVPAAADQGPVYIYAFKVKPGRVKGALSEYQTGNVILAGDALHLQGKAQLPSDKRVFFLFLGTIGRIVAASVRVDRADRLTWDCVHQIVLEPEKRRICLVYTLPGKPKRPYSLAFLVGDLYDNFTQAARYYAGDRVSEGKIGPATPLWAWIVIALFLALVLWGAFSGGGSHP